MLSRTADHLFWMARYIERAENTARMLDVTLSTSLLPQPAEDVERAWRAVLGISELQAAYDSRFGATTRGDVLDFLVRDATNPSSIYCCLQAARENARAVRGSITTEVWETHNDTWLELQQHLRSKLLARDPQQFFEWVKFRSHLSRGVTIGTMLKDEAFYFVRLGTFLERADNTARLVDVKFHAAPQQPGGVAPAPAQTHTQTQTQTHTQTPTHTQTQAKGGAAQAQAQGAGDSLGHHLDFYYWAAILRSVSAFEIYRKVYRDIITPARVAELLILRDDMPRSLMYCLNEVCSNLEKVRNSRSGETERRAGLLRAELQYGRIIDIQSQGLHAYLTRFMERVNDLGGRISQDFLVPISTSAGAVA
ncbi:MAG: alpha-E domain-containing protein [Betaproteobacteria bacterium]